MHCAGWFRAILRASSTASSLTLNEDRALNVVNKEHLRNIIKDDLCKDEDDDEDNDDGCSSPNADPFRA